MNLEPSKISKYLSIFNCQQDNHVIFVIQEKKNKATAKNSVSGSPNVPGSHMQTRKYKL